MNDIVREFLLETNENLAQLDLDLVTLEKEPGERETLARVFRTLHTVKGTAGFLGLSRLQAVSHAGENLLSRLRNGDLTFNPEIANALLGVVDVIREVLGNLEATEQEGDGNYAELIQTLERLTRASGIPSARVSTVPKSEPPVPAPTPSVVVGPVRVSLAPDPPSPAPAPVPAPVSIVTGEPAEFRGPAVADSSIRVDVGLLDRLMTLVGELVLARNQILQFGATREDTGYAGTLQRFNLLTTELQAGVMKTRMQPIGTLWGKFPRIVRDLAVACGKQVRLEQDGQETELDKTILEAIRDPLTHIVRNAVDHGIEPPGGRAARGKPAEGRLSLHAFHEGGKVIIQIADDGGGIDPARVRDKAIRANLISPEQAARMTDRDLVNLVFLPGFSTADRVTHFSGRGVGMDVVRTNIEKIGGTVDLDTRLGRGTTVRMKIPLTLAIIPALTISCRGDRYYIPQVSLLELVRLEGEQARTGIEWLHGVPVYRLRGNLLPVVYLDQELELKLKTETHATDDVTVVVLQAEDRTFGLVVDEIHDTEEIVVKPLQKQIKDIAAYAGATIMGDGRVALILDVLGLAQRAGVIAGVRERSLVEKPATASGEIKDHQPILLVSSSAGGRMAIPLTAVARLEEFPRTTVERVGRQDVVQYRGQILPLIHVERALRNRPAGTDRVERSRSEAPAVSADENVQVVVCRCEGRQVGLVVGRILDITEESSADRGPAARPSVRYTAVVQGRVTEFLDVDSLVRSVANPAPVSGGTGP